MLQHLASFYENLAFFYDILVNIGRKTTRLLMNHFMMNSEPAFDENLATLYWKPSQFLWSPS